ncbi:flagellum-specific ATP synthase FliI [Rhodobacterales bacterium 52_120_T64]|nr:flagellum-specific ATP synthase FliI [Rhodobacterales bacterium 52_120_T64]
MFIDFKPLRNTLFAIPASRRFGKVDSVGTAAIRVGGLSVHGHLGDQLTITKSNSTRIDGEIIALEKSYVLLMPYGPSDGIAIGDLVELNHTNCVYPAETWVGRIIDAFGEALDGRPLYRGEKSVPLRRPPPAAASRRSLGARLNTSLAIFNTVLPIARGQRIGVFAGSGVGKSSLLAEMARGLDCDIVVIALIGERGRELREFTERVLGAQGMKRAVVIAATSDQSPLVKRRAAWMAMAVAEYFRDQGKHVLLLMDSITRFAEAHREVALTAGEPPSLRAFPPSTANLIASLTERAGPGPDGTGDITAIFSVLVAGSDMEEPIADITRGVLDGHIILEREIAESGRFPAIDITRSVSRCLPESATHEENAVIVRVRKILGIYEKSAPMILTGLYTKGSSEEVDEAISVHIKLEHFFARNASEPINESFKLLTGILGRPE